MQSPLLAKIERGNLAAGALLTAASGLFGGPTSLVAAALGTGIGCLNFVVMGRIAAAAVRAATLQREAGAARGLGAVLALKMVVLFSLVALVLRLFALPLLPFTLGLVVFVPSALAHALWVGATGREAEI